MDPRWIKKLVIVTILIMLAVSISNISTIRAADKQGSLAEFTAYLNERIPALMKKYDIPGVSIALVQKGEISWSQAYGYADLNAGRKMTVDTYCRVQSISKSVTAWGVMKLVEQGKVDLDVPVEQYFNNWEFPESEFSVEKVTIRQLLSLTAGMPLGNITQRFSPEEETPSIIESLSKEAVLIQEPGKSFYYSNVSINLLELLIEEVSGRDFEEYMEEEILIPLGMHNSSFTWSKDLDPPVPFGYDLKGKPVPVYVYAGKASGGLFASVEDVATFISAGSTGPYRSEHSVLKPETIDKLYVPEVDITGLYALAFDYYGLGHFIENLSGNRLAVSHGGQGAGIMTHYHSIPETGDGIVILTNSQRSWPLIAYILRDWSDWSGHYPIGMGNIILGKNILCAVIGLALLASLWQLWRLSIGLIMGRRHFAPLAKESRPLRIGQGALFIILVSILLWAINQEYLNITSLFPVVSIWLGYTALVVSVVSLLSALFISDHKVNSYK